MNQLSFVFVLTLVMRNISAATLRVTTEAPDEAENGLFVLLLIIALIIGGVCITICSCAYRWIAACCYPERMDIGPTTGYDRMNTVA
ncbi:unnamed protein product [Diamesa serratosioi]